MTFAYSGLLGVYFTVLFTRRGSSASVICALATGFIAIALQQAYVVDMLGLPASWKSLAFPYQLCLGTAVAFATCLLGNQRRPAIELALPGYDSRAQPIQQSNHSSS